MNYETEYWEAQQFIDWLHRPENQNAGFGTTTYTDAAYKQYLASLEEQERRESEE
jgi:ABC-type glycerol-3-phosphate transport system substrate-binding protein